MTLEIHRGRGHVPVRVVAHMAEPIAYLGDLLHLDGPLHYATYHDLDERTRRTIEPMETTAWPIDLALPLATWSVEAPAGVDDRLLKSRNGLRRAGTDCPPGTERRLWGWCASAADEAAWQMRGVVEVRKKPELGRMARYTPDRTAQLSAGHLKAYDLALPTVTSLEVTWHALGEPDRIRYLLTRYIPALGKKRNLGNGTVQRWTVEACAEDRSLAAPDGAPMRRLPHGAIAGAPGHGAIRPPYYHAGRAVESVEPWA